MAARRVTTGGMVALAASVLGLAALACCFVASTHSSARSAELLYRRPGDWGGFLSGQGMYPHSRARNSLSKADLQLLKLANAEEKKENSDALKAKKADNEALQVREAKKAAEKAKAAKQHKKAALPAPYFSPVPAKKAGALTHKDQQLLHIAEKEMKDDNKKALTNKAKDEQAEHARQAQKAARAKKEAEVKKAQAKEMKQKDTNPSSWGGWLPFLAKKKAADDLDPKSIQLLRTAYDDQRHDTMMGNLARARDDSAYATMYKHKATMLTGKAKKEALMELNRIDRKASIGLNAATYQDDTELQHSWKHTLG